MAKKRASRKPQGISLEEQFELAKIVKRQQAQGFTGHKSSIKPLAVGEYSPQASRVKAGLSARDSMSNRTVEYGTRSMLQGLRSWIRGGGGSILRGR